MNRSALRWVIMVLSIVLIASNGEAVVITFDDVASGTKINTQYAASGMTFGCFGGTVSNECSAPGLTGGDAFAVASPGAQSPPNVIGISPTLFPFIDERFGFYKVSFASPVGFVTVDAAPVLPPEFLGATSNHPFLDVYNSSGTHLARVEWTGDVTTGAYHTLEITRVTNDISLAVFSSFNSSGFPVYGIFDNFDPLDASAGGNVARAVDLGPPPGGGNTIGLIAPGPPSLLLAGLGLALFGLSRRLMG